MEEEKSPIEKNDRVKDYEIKERMDKSYKERENILEKARKKADTHVTKWISRY